MPNGEPALIATLTLGLAFAFAGGFLSQKAKLPVILGYLIGGIAVGPFTPGFVANVELARELAEVGLILLMFGVGLHFSIHELLAVRGIATVGGLGQIAGVTAAVAWATTTMGWELGEGIVLGLALSIASTVVAVRALTNRGELDSPQGHITVGWLLVEDLIAVMALVLLPTLGVGADGASGAAEFPLGAAVIVVAKLAVFASLMVFAGNRLLPWLLAEVARMGSRELFTLGVLVSALGVAVAATALFGLSFALGAFVAGVVVGESDLSHQAAADALPLRDAFAVLFFVSVGMIFDPGVILAEPVALLATLAAIVLLTPLMAVVIALAFGYPLRVGLIIAAALAQIGEFSFVLAELGRHSGMLRDTGYNLVIAGALGSIAINPLCFRFVEWLGPRAPGLGSLGRMGRRRGGGIAHPSRSPAGPELRNHAILCGHGRVGQLIGGTLARRGLRYVVIEENRSLVERLRRQEVTALYGDASNPALLEHAGLKEARILLIAIPDPAAVRRIVDHARRVRPDLDIVARTHSESEWAHLRDGRVNEAVLGERELAIEMLRHTLQRFGVSAAETMAITQRLRLGE